MFTQQIPIGKADSVYRGILNLRKEYEKYETSSEHTKMTNENAARKSYVKKKHLITSVEEHTQSIIFIYCISQSHTDISARKIFIIRQSN